MTACATSCARIQEEQLLDDGTNPAERPGSWSRVTPGRHSASIRSPSPSRPIHRHGLGRIPVGAAGRILAGRDKKDHTWAAISKTHRRGSAGQDRLPSHTVGAPVNNRDVYLHAGGGIGAEGVVRGCPRHLDGAAALFCFPDPPDSTYLWARSRRRVVYRSSRNDEGRRPDPRSGLQGAARRIKTLGVAFPGESGLGKSEFLAIGQRVYGPGMDPSHLPPRSLVFDDDGLRGAGPPIQGAVFGVDDFKTHPGSRRYEQTFPTRRPDRLLAGARATRAASGGFGPGRYAPAGSGAAGLIL